MALAALALALFQLWPASLGGRTAYVSTHGSSMEPGIHQGDLVLVRKASSYAVGDVVAYRSGTLRTTVLHRIVERAGDTFVTKGDNNDFLDKDRPTADQLIGRRWIKIGGAGPFLGALRISMPLLALGASLLGANKVRSRRDRRRPAHLAPSPAPATTSLRNWRTATLVAGGTALAAVAVGTVAFGRPSSSTATETIGYHQRGEFTYGSPAPPGPVYADGRIDTGEPVFLRMVDGLDVAFDYDFEADATTEVRGELAVDAVVGNGTGWIHRISLQPRTPFTDDDARAKVRLDVRAVEALVAEVRAATGVEPSRTTVDVAPRVTIEATVDGRHVEETFEPRLPFTLDPLQLRLPPDAELVTSDAGKLDRSTTRANDLAAFGVGVPVAAARAAAVGLGAPAVVVAAAGALVLRRRLEREDARIELRHGHRMVPVAGARSDVVEVRSIEDLARMAEQYQALILHRETSRGHDYVLQVDGVVYRYTTREKQPAGRLG